MYRLGWKGILKRSLETYLTNKIHFRSNLEGYDNEGKYTRYVHFIR